MDKKIIFIFLLTIIAGIVGKIYLNTWEKKNRIESFLKEETSVVNANLNSSLSKIKDKKVAQTNSDFPESANDIKDNSKQESSIINNEIPQATSNFNKEVNKLKPFNSLKPQIKFEVKNKIISKPFILRTHKNNKYHIIIQDEKFNIYLVDERGKLIWKKPLKDKIITDIFEIDYLKNKKKQYLFATSKFLFLIDYNGNRVGKYPYKLNALQKPAFLNVIDYSKNKDYRIALTTEEGNLYLFDKRFKVLPGWAPKRLKAQLIEKLIHFRVNKKDYLIIAKKYGELLLIKRNGNVYTNFPIKLKESIKSFIPIKGKNKERSSLVILTKNNLLCEYDFTGNKKLELKPIRPDEEATLILLKDQKNYNSYALLKKLPNQIIILDNLAKEILRTKINYKDDIQAKFYLFGNNKIFAINNIPQNKLEIYKSKKVLSPKPIKALNKYDLVYTKFNNSIKVFNCIKNKLEIYTIYM